MTIWPNDHWIGWPQQWIVRESWQLMAMVRANHLQSRERWLVENRLVRHWINLSKKTLATISYGQLTSWGDNEEWLRAKHMVSSGKGRSNDDATFRLLLHTGVRFTVFTVTLSTKEGPSSGSVVSGRRPALDKRRLVLICSGVEMSHYWNGISILLIPQIGRFRSSFFYA